MGWVASLYGTQSGHDSNVAGLNSHVAGLDGHVASLDSLGLIGCDFPCTDVLVSVYAVLPVTGGYDSHILIVCSAACSGIQDSLAGRLSRMLGLPGSQDVFHLPVHQLL